MERYLRGVNPAVSARIADLRQQIHRELGTRSRVIAAAVGPLLHWAARRDARRHPAGRRLEPRTFVEHTNWA
jgi:hypothetical protein